MQGYSSSNNGSLGENSLTGRGNLSYHESYSSNPNGYNSNQGVTRTRERRMEYHTNYSRRIPQLAPYTLTCDHEPLNSRLGIPDFFPHTETVEEEVLNKENIQSGYRETVTGIEDGKETNLVLTMTLNSANQIWNKKNILKYRQAVKKQFHSLSTALSRKRKAGQVYGVALDGNLVSKFGNFSDQKNFGEEFRRKWMQDLSGRKKLCILSESVPHGFRKKSLFESLLKQNVPFLRATWFIKTMFLNQIRPSSMHARSDKSLTTRTDTWTNDVLDFAKSLLDELAVSDTWHNPFEVPLNDDENSFHNTSIIENNENQSKEVDINHKWSYLIRLIYWNVSENILSKSLLIDWIFKQIMEKESINVIEALLPLLKEMKVFISLSSFHTRQCMDLLLRIINFLSPLFFTRILHSTNQSFSFKSFVVEEGMSMEEERKSTRNVHLTNDIISFLYSLFLSSPDAFVSYEYLPLLSSFLPNPVLLEKEEEEEKEEVEVMVVGEVKGTESVNGSMIEKDVKVDNTKSDTVSEFAQSAESDVRIRQYLHHVMEIKESLHDLKTKSDFLSLSANPSFLQCNETKFVLILDQSLTFADVDSICDSIFGNESDWTSDRFPEMENNLFSSNVNASDHIKFDKISSKLFFALKVLCDWAIFGFQNDVDGKKSSENDKNGKKRILQYSQNHVCDDYSSIFFTVSVLKTQQLRWMESRRRKKKKKKTKVGLGGEENIEASSKKSEKESSFNMQKNALYKKRKDKIAMMGGEYDIMHDLIIRWIDGFEFSSKNCMHRLQVFLNELVKQNVFNPNIYLHKLIADGYLEDDFASSSSSSSSSSLSSSSSASKHPPLLPFHPFSPYLSYSSSLSSSFLPLSSTSPSSTSSSSSSSPLRSPQHRFFLSFIPCPPHLETFLESHPLIPESFFSSLSTEQCSLENQNLSHGHSQSQSQSQIMNEEARRYECEKRFALHKIVSKKRKRMQRKEEWTVRSSHLFDKKEGMEIKKMKEKDSNVCNDGKGEMGKEKDESKLTMAIDSILLLLKFPHSCVLKCENNTSFILLDSNKMNKSTDCMESEVKIREEEIKEIEMEGNGDGNVEEKEEGEEEEEEEGELWWVKKPKLEKSMDAQIDSYYSTSKMASHLNTNNVKRKKNEPKNGFFNTSITAISQKSHGDFTNQNLKLSSVKNDTEKFNFATRTLEFNRSESVSELKGQNCNFSQSLGQNRNLKCKFDTHHHISTLKSNDKRKLCHWIRNFVFTVISIEKREKKEEHDDGNGENKHTKMVELSKLHCVEEKTSPAPTLTKKQSQSKSQNKSQSPSDVSKNENGILNLENVKTGNRARGRMNKNKNNNNNNNNDDKNDKKEEKEKDRKGEANHNNNINSDRNNNINNVNYLQNKSLLSWRLDDEKLQWMIYFLDLLSDYSTLIDILLCLLPFSSTSFPSASPFFSSNSHGEMQGKNNLKDKFMNFNNEKASVFDLSDSFLLCCFQKYEKYFLATDRLPHLLSSLSKRITKESMEGKNFFSPLLLFYLKGLLSRHIQLSSVKNWQLMYKEKNGMRIFNELDNVKMDEKGECHLIKDKNSSPFSPFSPLSPSQTKKSAKEGKEKKTKNANEDENAKMKLMDTIFHDCLEGEMDEIIEIERRIAVKDKIGMRSRSNSFHLSLRKSNSVSDSVDFAFKEMEWAIRFDLCVKNTAMRLAVFLRQNLSVNSSKLESQKQDENLISKCVRSMLTSLTNQMKRVVDSFVRFASELDSSFDKMDNCSEAFMFDLPEHFDFDSNANFDPSLFDFGDFEKEKEKEKNASQGSGRKHNRDDLEKSYPSDDVSKFVMQKKVLSRLLANPRLVNCSRTLLGSYSKCYRLLKENLGRKYDRVFDTCLLADVATRMKNSTVSIAQSHVNKQNVHSSPSPPCSKTRKLEEGKYMNDSVLNELTRQHSMHADGTGNHMMDHDRSGSDTSSFAYANHQSNNQYDSMFDNIVFESEFMDMDVDMKKKKKMEMVVEEEMEMEMNANVQNVHGYVMGRRRRRKRKNDINASNDIHNDEREEEDEMREEDDVDIEVDISIDVSIGFLLDSASKGHFSLSFLIDALKLKEMTWNLDKIVSMREMDVVDKEKNDHINHMENLMAWIVLLVGDSINLKNEFFNMLLDMHTCMSLKRMQENMAMEDVFHVLFPFFSSFVDACMKDESIATILSCQLKDAKRMEVKGGGGGGGEGVEKKGKYKEKKRKEEDGMEMGMKHEEGKKEKTVRMFLLVLNECFQNKSLKYILLQNSHSFLSCIQKANSNSNLTSNSNSKSSVSPSPSSSPSPSPSFLCRLFLDCLLQEGMDMEEMEEERKVNDSKKINGEFEFKSMGLGKKEDGNKQFYSNRSMKNEMLMKRIWHVLSKMNSMEFKFQSIQIRLLLNEQIQLENEQYGLHENEKSNQSQSQSQNHLSECEKNFVSTLISSIVHFPQSSILFSQLLSFLGKNMENWLVLQIKWILEGSPLLLGQKSLQNHLQKLAQKNFYTERTEPRHQRTDSLHRPHSKDNPAQQRMAWHHPLNREENDKTADVRGKGEEGMPDDHSGKVGEEEKEKEMGMKDASANVRFLPFYAERALAELALPCLLHAPEELRLSFMADLSKQLSNLEKHMSNFHQHAQLSDADVATHVSKGMKNGRLPPVRPHDLAISIGNSTLGTFSVHGEGDGSHRFLNRKEEKPPPSSSISPSPSPLFAFRNSIWLRLQFLIPLFPVLFSERESSSKNMRQSLAVIFLRLLSSPIIHSPPSLSPSPSRPYPHSSLPHLGDQDSSELADSFASRLAGDDLFERILSLLHALTHSALPTWLHPLPSVRSPSRNQREKEIVSMDKELVDRLQTELDSFHLEASLHRRIRCTLPSLPFNPTLSFSSSIISHETFLGRKEEKRNGGRNEFHASSVRPSSSPNPVVQSSKSLTSALTLTLTSPLTKHVNNDSSELDPWLFLEEGATGFGSAGVSNLNSNSNSNSNLNPNSNLNLENSNLKASHLLKGCIRVSKTSLSYAASAEKESEEEGEEEEEEMEVEEED